MTIKEFGCKGHFVCADRCQWSRHTEVGGKYKISSMGELWIEDKLETIGGNSLYETMVFEIKPETIAENCGSSDFLMPEIDSDRYNTCQEANEGHDKMVQKWLRKSRAKRV